MSTSDPQYAPLMQGDWSDGEEEMYEKRAAHRQKNGGSALTRALRYDRRHGQMKPLYVFLSIVGVITAGVVVAVIAGVISRQFQAQPHPKPQLQLQPQTTKEPAHESPSIDVTNPSLKNSPKKEGPKASLSVTHVPPMHVQNSHNWRVLVNTTGTESCVRTPDIDGDGLPDVLVGLANDVDLDLVNALDEENSLKNYCEERNRTYPCVGFLLALRGYDGKELWRVPTRSEVIFIVCDIDLNGDGHQDCVVSGRQSIIQAVDLRNGKTLWYSDGTEYHQYFQQLWNVYQPVPLVDVTGDGVPEILVAHGGNPNLDAKIHDREAGRLIVLSGATGEPMGDYLKMPASKETYMSPVLYTDHDGSQYVVFGSGGETVPGDLMALTLPDLFKATNVRVKRDHEFPGSFAWKKFLESDSDIMVLYRGEVKGIMVPPVFIDIDNDGMDDILVSVFEGSMVLLDGRTLKPKWTANFPGCESYSTPAPGYFDADEYLDFMVHWSTGAWPMYNDSTVLVLSGRDGITLWRDTRPLYVMSSDLVLRTQEHRMDYFMVKMRGRKSGVGSLSRSEAHGVGAQRNISRRSTKDEECAELETEFRKRHLTCDHDMGDLTEEIYMVSRNTQGELKSIQELAPQKMTYSFKAKDPENSCVPVDDNGDVHLCVVMLPESRSTDAVTDVDNDGRLDLINLGILEGRLRDSRYSYAEMEYNTVISRVDVEAVLEHKSQPTMNVLAPYSAQPWLAYLGTSGNSVYRRYNEKTVLL